MCPDLQAYASRLVEKPRIREGMEHIKQPSGDDTHCTCDRKQFVKKKTANTSPKASSKEKKPRKVHDFA